MKVEDRNNFYVVMKGCSEIYVQDLSDAIVNIFWDILKTYDIESVKNAFSNYLRNPKHTFFPKPAQIIEEIEGKLEHRSLLAWSKTLDAIKTYQYYRSLLFDDEIIHQVIKDFGGLEDFGFQIETTKGISFVQKEFRERYEMYVGGAKMNPPNYLIGQSERNQKNFVGNATIAPPTIIGDSEKAQEIYLRLSAEVEKKSPSLQIFQKAISGASSKDISLP